MPSFRTSAPARAEVVLPAFVGDYLAHGAPEGTRNETIYRVAQQMHAAGIQLAEAEARIMPRALAEAPRAEAEIRQAIASAYKSTKVVEQLTRFGPAARSVATVGTSGKLGFLDALRAAFLPGETIAVVEARQNEDGDWKPSTATLKTLEGWEKWIAKMGDVNKLAPSTEGGLFIGINPYRLGSDRRSNDNVAVFRHVLCEWDGLGMDEQRERLMSSGLPLSLVVTSGGKSVHGWVRVDATTKSEWDKRREEVHKLLGCDPKNKDLARVSRCPGAMRGAVEQQVLAVNVGPKSWAAYEARNEWTPDSWGVCDLVERGPDPEPEVIRGVLRRGCQMQLSSGPKMRKSYTLLDLALSVATGRPWLGLETVAGPVFYADAENQLALIRQRIGPVAASRGITLDAGLNERLVFCPLRSRLRGRSLIDIVAGVVRAIRAMREPPVLAILEPLYLLLRGAKEKEAEEVTAALEELDEVCRECGCAIVYVHHFSKGAQGAKASMDRASGSGALSRYPDAIVTLTPPEEPKKKGEAKPDYDAVVSMDMRWFAKRPDFPIWWRGSHYEPQRTSRPVAAEPSARPRAEWHNIAKAMPSLRRGKTVESCAVCGWLSQALGITLGAAWAAFGELSQGGLTLVSEGDGQWHGVEWPF